MYTKEIKKEIKVIYSELEGYLVSIPKSNITEENIWNGYNSIISHLEKLSNKDYSRFKVAPKNERWDHGTNPETGESYGYTLHIYIDLDEYKSKLDGLIRVLRAEYDLDVDNDNINNRNAVFNISQSQSLANDVRINIINETTSLIDKVSQKYEAESKEKNFLDKIREKIPNIKNSLELVMLILKIAKDFGFSAEKIIKIFS